MTRGRGSLSARRCHRRRAYAASKGFGAGDSPRGQRRDRLRDRADVRGRRAAAAADEVDEAVPREILDEPRGLRGRLVVAGVSTIGFGSPAFG